MYNTASELYDVLLETYFDEYDDLSDGKRSKMTPNMVLLIWHLMSMTTVNGIKKQPDD